MKNITLQEVEDIMGPLEKAQERMNDIKLYFHSNEINLSEYRHVGQLIINKFTREARVRDISSVYTTSGTPLEVMDVHTRMASYIRRLDLTVIY